MDGNKAKPYLFLLRPLGGEGHLINRAVIPALKHGVRLLVLQNGKMIYYYCCCCCCCQYYYYYYPDSHCTHLNPFSFLELFCAGILDTHVE